ncbi:MAG: phosphate ABC transporter permease subunit PstC [Acidimicrobiales bacterium]
MPRSPRSSSGEGRALPGLVSERGGRSLASRILPAGTGVAAVIPLLGLAFIILVLLLEALPAIPYNGVGFFTHTEFNLGSSYGVMVHTGGVAHPQGAGYGILGWAMGTLLTTAIAGVIAIPVSVLGALAIVFKLPRQASTFAGFFLELLAGIPSVVIGLWGVFTLGPLIGHSEGLLTAGLVLSIMVIPIVASTTRDLFRSVPVLQRDGATALGMTEWEVVRTVTLPWVAAGIVGAAVLGLARALGETMAVAMTIGVVLSASVPSGLFGSFTTVSATIVTQLDSALTDTSGFAVRSLAEAALALAVITLAVNLLARLLVKRVAVTGLPVGRGI